MPSADLELRNTKIIYIDEYWYYLLGAGLVPKPDMPNNHGIFISVVCNGTVLDEYAVQQLDERTVSCFVPSVKGSVSSATRSPSRSTNVLALGIEL